MENQLPVRWSTNQNIRWRATLPGPGNSTPVVWDQRIFITQAIENRRTVMCFDRATGKQLWMQGPAYAEVESTHETNPQGSSSPVTDGERVLAWFGSAGLYCYDVDGKELWHREFGRQKHIWGWGSSPVLSGDLCYLNFGPGEPSFLVAVEKATGREVWRVPESNADSGEKKAGQDTAVWMGSWSTPVVIRAGQRQELVLSAPNRVEAFDPKTGRELWNCGGLNPLVYTSPLYDQQSEIIVAMGGYMGMTLAVKAGGSGDVTQTRRLWHHPKTKQRIGSGVIHDDHIYILNDPGVAECFELQTGKLVWEERLKGPAPKSDNWSSMVAANGKLYVVNQGGDSFVLKAGPKFEVLATNSLGETTISSPAVSDGEIFIRTHQALWCIGERLEAGIHETAQPLIANATRLVEALDSLGVPLPEDTKSTLAEAARVQDVDRLQETLDAEALFIVEINPETRVKARRGPGKVSLRQGAYVPAIVKIINLSKVTMELHITSPQAGQVYSGMTPLSAKRMQRESLHEVDAKNPGPDKFLEIEMFGQSPMTAHLSGLELEYALALIYSRDAGPREATICFDLGSQTQDLGFRAEVPMLFDVQPAVPVTLHILDSDGTPATASLIFRDHAGHVYPPQAKRIAPDFYFQPQIYRADGDVVQLPPGKLTVEFTRGPEYRRLRREVTIPRGLRAELSFQLERWIDPPAFGFYSGDHHIHGAGCAHYTSPTEGVTPEDMFKQVDGEGLNVGCVLTWGPCFDYQRKFFAPSVNWLSKPLTVMKYDLEISGFGSEALGHVCLLNLKDQTFPGSDGTKTKGWPSWTLPVMEWTKKQGGVAGYAHSASGLEIDTASAVKRIFQRFDANHDGRLDARETQNALLPFAFGEVDEDHDDVLTEAELAAAHERAASELPNFAVPAMNGVGAMEICVTVPQGACDFISAMDTPRLAEWNMWYHILNCGFPLKVSGETDFPCMSGERVGQGRVYVQLGRQKRIDFASWCDALAQGRSYVSDGFAHALVFKVNSTAPGFGEVRLASAGNVAVEAQVAFGPETPALVAHGFAPPSQRWSGDTVTLHGARNRDVVSGGDRLVEIVVNGRPVASAQVPADGQLHSLQFRVPITRSSWVALRQFPQLHTNPVDVRIGDAPIRASRRSGLWCIETIERLREQRRRSIREPERAAAMEAYDRAVETFHRRAAEAPEGS